MGCAVEKTVGHRSVILTEGLNIWVSSSYEWAAEIMAVMRLQETYVGRKS